MFLSQRGALTFIPERSHPWGLECTALTENVPAFYHQTWGIREYSRGFPQCVPCVSVTSIHSLCIHLDFYLSLLFQEKWQQEISRAVQPHKSSGESCSSPLSSVVPLRWPVLFLVTEPTYSGTKCLYGATTKSAFSHNLHRASIGSGPLWLLWILLWFPLSFSLFSLSHIGFHAVLHTHTVCAHSCLKTSVWVVSSVWNALHPHTHMAHSVPSFKPVLQSHILKGAQLPHPNCSSPLSCSMFFTHFYSTYHFLIQYKCTLFVVFIFYWIFSPLNVNSLMSCLLCSWMYHKPLEQFLAHIRLSLNACWLAQILETSAWYAFCDIL